ncbi:MAG: histidine kinase, partial [Patulibacter sp.]|nr:histidine kinase [Patulibacter sp.]
MPTPAHPDPPRVRARRAVTPLFWFAVVALGAASIRSVLVSDTVAEAHRPAVVGLALVTTAAMACGRRVPLPALVVIYVSGLLACLLEPTIGAGAPVQSIVVAYCAGRRTDGARLVAALAASCVLFAVTRALADWDMAFGAFVATIAASILGPAALGRGVRDRTRLRTMLQARAAAEEADRQERTSRALLEERARIAGELHDVVAHALSAMVVQASGARLFATRDEERASAAFATVERTGRDALFEIRSLLGVLREHDDLGSLEPQPTLDHLPALVHRTERGGLPTSLRTDGVPRPVPSGIALAAYRAVQDALRAARDQGGAGRAEVVLVYEPSGLRLTVVDDG